MTFDEAGEDVGEMGFGIDVVEFVGFDERGENGPVLALPSDPAKSEFFQLRSSGRMLRATTLESISM